MFDVGRLMLGVKWDGERVRETAVTSTRPMASQVLKGKTPAQVVQIVPLLFSVCGRAQGAAAHAALHAAGADGTAKQCAQAIACEALQEHLWRLMLDWPKQLGLTAQESRFTAWYGLLRKIGGGELAMEEFLREFEREVLGMPSAQWRAMTADEMQGWWQHNEHPLAALLARLADTGEKGACAVHLLPAWSAAEAQQACGGKWSAEFAAQPHWQGAAAETGAWSYYADLLLLGEVARRYGNAMARVLARLIDVTALADGSATARLDAQPAGENEGIAAVRTARGLLLHHVRLEAGKVADYTIVAPTEWNFHPAGAFAQGLCGRAMLDNAAVQKAASIEALSLDPCVAYEVKISGANDA